VSFSPAVPKETLTHRNIIGSMSPGAAVGPGGLSVISASGASNAWPAANLGLFIPFQTNERAIVYEGFIATGTLTGGNFDIGIFDLAGTRLANAGATARAGASVWQNVAMTDYTLEPGEYYMGMAADATSNYIAWIPAAGLCEALGVCEDTTSYSAGLSATVTYVRTTRAVIPMFGFNLKSVSI